MKTNLLKLALCAIAALPIGAWADSEVTYNYAKLATDNLGKGNTVNVTLSSTSEGTINSQTVKKFSYTGETEIISETEVVTNRPVYFRFNNNSNIGLYHANDTQYGVKDLKVGDKIIIATNNGSSTAGVEPASLVNLSRDEGTSTYTHNFDDGGTARTLDYTVYSYTVTSAGLAGFQLTGAYVGYIKVIRYSNTACSVSTSTFTVGGDNPDESLTSSSTTGTWTNSGSFSFTLTVGSTSSGSLVRNANGYRMPDNTIPVNLNKSGDGIYEITKSPNIKSVTLYAKNTSDTEGGTIYADFKLGTQTQLCTTLPTRSSNPSSFDITNYSNIRVAQGTYVTFAIEYYTPASLSIADIEWASLYLPVAVAIPSGVKAYYASAVSSSSVTLTELTENIPANTGVLINAESGTYNFTPASTEIAAISGNKFKGITADASTTSLDDAGIFVLSGATNDKSAPKFATYTGATLGAYKAYIPKKVNGISGITALDFIFEEATAVQNVVAAPQASNAGVKKYFENGKLVIESNGVKYNVAGAQVK